MSLTIKCPECEKSLKVKEEAAGKKVRCPACATAFLAPGLAPGKKKASPPDDDFLADLGQAAKSSRKRPAQDEDFEDEDELPVTKSRPRPPVKKKSGGRKPKGPNWLLIGGLSAAGLVGLFLLVVVVGQAIKMAANQKANWITFQHPMGFIQGEMPGTPTYNVKQSVNGSQTYTLNRRNCQMSMTSIVLPPGVSSNPTAVDLMFNEIKNKTPQQVPGSRLLSSRRMLAGTTPALEMKIDVKGNVNLMRFYIFPDAVVAAEFITRTETAHQADRERFFNSLRGPDGNLIN